MFFFGEGSSLKRRYQSILRKRRGEVLKNFARQAVGTSRCFSILGLLRFGCAPGPPPRDDPPLITSECKDGLPDSSSVSARQAAALPNRADSVRSPVISTGRSRCARSRESAFPAMHSHLPNYSSTTGALMCRRPWPRRRTWIWSWTRRRIITTWSAQVAFIIILQSILESVHVSGSQVSAAYRWHNQVSDQGIGVSYGLLDAARIRAISYV